MTGESLSLMLRPGNAGSKGTNDHSSYWSRRSAPREGQSTWALFGQRGCQQLRHHRMNWRTRAHDSYKRVKPQEHRYGQKGVTNLSDSDERRTIGDQHS